MRTILQKTFGGANVRSEWVNVITYIDNFGALHTIQSDVPFMTRGDASMALPFMKKDLRNMGFTVLNADCIRLS